MATTLAFPLLLQLIDERSTAFRAAVAAASSLDEKVPTCPEWTLLDLAHHIGQGRRAWAATVAAGPEATTKSAPEGTPPTDEDREALLVWLAESTRQLLDALREAGPDRGCWTWWQGSQSPHTCGAVARHQLHEVAVHTYDAHLTVGTPQPLPDTVALDGAAEFLSTCCASASPWPHEPATVDFHATEGSAWRLTLNGDGARYAPLDTTEPTAVPAGVSVRGTANELALFMYGRLPMDALQLDGDRGILDLLRSWEPEEAVTVQHLTRPAGLPPTNGYSHAVVASGPLLAVSGQVPVDATGQLVGADGDTTAQLRQVFHNLTTALTAAGGGWHQVIKLTVYLVDLADLPAFRTVRDEFIDTARPPASSLVQVSALVHPAFRVEIDALAVLAEP